MTRLLVEIADFTGAARAMNDRIAEPTDVASGRLASALLGLGSMAGNDPGGENWARVYDSAARSALLAAQQVVNAAYRTASMFARSGRNYAEAESASSPAPVTLGPLPAVGWSGPPPPLPTAAGGDGGHPTGWDLVEHLVGYVWPDGHQDRLHRAAHAGTAAADELDDASSHAAVVSVGFSRDALPEADDICTVCRGLSDHLADLSVAFRGLADACTDLAHHIDVCHDAVVAELGDLLAWSAGIQAGGALLSVVTIGIAEAPTQAAQLAKIAAAAKKIEELILVFVDAARALADTLPSVAMAAERIRAAMEGLAGARLAVAGMEVVPAARAAGTAGRGVRLTKDEVDELRAMRTLSRTEEVGLPERSLVNVDDPEKFDAHTLRGMSPEVLRASIPRNWIRRTSARGKGIVFEDPSVRGRQIRIMEGYPRGTRPDPITDGPYAVVSQNGTTTKIALEGNPTL